MTQVICSTLILLLLVACSTLEPTPTATFTSVPTATFTPAPTANVSTDINEVPRISTEELKSRLDKGETILVVDVRSVNAFETQHIAGAISVPLNQIESRLDEFPREQEIVFY